MSTDRDALARALYEEFSLFKLADDKPLDRVVVDDLFNLYEIADHLLARWRLVPVEQELPGPDWDDPDNPKIARGSASVAFNNYLDASLDMDDGT